MAYCEDLLSAPAVVEVAAGAAIPVETAASVYFDLGEKLDLHWLRDRIAALPRDNRWQALSRAALRDDLYAQLSALTQDTLRLDAGEAAPPDRVDAWLRQNRIPVARCRQIVADLMNAGDTDFAMLSVAMGEIRTLRHTD